MDKCKPVLMIADSERDSNIFYATRFTTPDPFTYIMNNGRTFVVVNDLEFDRAGSQATVDDVLAYSKYEKIAKKNGIKSPAFIDVIEVVLTDMNIRQAVVPGDFNISYADILRKRGFTLDVKAEPFIDTREIKSSDEVASIVKTQRGVEDAMHRAVEEIRTAQIKRGFLYTKAGDRLTSESMREMINIELLRNGFLARHTIVSCGRQASIPHCVGDGDLRANEPIIFDVFPKDEKTGYYADMSRTIVRGKASPRLKKMFNAVISAQESVFKIAADGVKGNYIHRKVVRCLKDAGFHTGKRTGRMQGFFHGTGHGVGLDVHEHPRISKKGGALKSGNVVTVEPGLYYPDVGGVRIEDMVLITDDGCINLTKFPKDIEV